MPLGAVGVGLTIILPSAYVGLDTEAVQPRPRMRIISAGAFHNLVLWLFLAAVATARLSEAVWPLLGYRDVRAYGRVVLRVDEVGGSTTLYGMLDDLTSASVISLATANVCTGTAFSAVRALASRRGGV